MAKTGLNGPVALASVEPGGHDSSFACRFPVSLSSSLVPRFWPFEPYLCPFGTFESAWKSKQSSAGASIEARSGAFVAGPQR